MRIRSSKFISAFVTLGLICCTSLTSQASVVFTGSGVLPDSGNTVSGSAQFTVSGDILTLVLTNTTPGGTLLRGDAMVGVAWDLALGLNPVLGFPTVGLTNGTDLIFTTKLLSNTIDPLSGSYTNVAGASPISQYGVATTGFGGAFAAGTITRGSGGEDYSIVADGTFPAPPGSGTSGSFNASAFPLIQNSLTFTFTGATGLSESRIQSVRLLYGTSGSGIIVAVPEPSSYISIALGLLAIAGRRTLRRRAAVRPIEPNQSTELS